MRSIDLARANIHFQVADLQDRTFQDLLLLYDPSLQEQCFFAACHDALQEACHSSISTLYAPV